MTANEKIAKLTKVVPTYFKGDPKFGRTTTLVHAVTGAVLFVGMGVCTRKQLIEGWRNQLAATAVPAAEVIANGPDLKIVNLDAMPRGTGCRYLEVIRAHTGDLIAKQWRREVPAAGIVVDLEPTSKG